MLNKIFACPVCNSKDHLIPGDDEGHIICDNEETFYEPHFSWQSGKEGFEGFVFGHYQIFFFDKNIEIYDLTDHRGRLVVDTESSVRFEDINSAEKLEQFIQNYKIIS